MKKLLVAVFANRACARQAQDALIGEGIRQAHMRITPFAAGHHAGAPSSDGQTRKDSLRYRKESLGRKVSKALGFEWDDDPTDVVVAEDRRSVLTVVVHDEVEADLAAQIAGVFGGDDICCHGKQSDSRPIHWAGEIKTRESRFSR